MCMCVCVCVGLGVLGVCMKKTYIWSTLDELLVLCVCVCVYPCVG